MLKNIFISFVVLVFVSGCGASKTPPAQKAVVKNTIPAWIDNPDFDGNIGAVGTVLKSKVKNPKKRAYIGKRLAIAALQERKNAFVDSSLKTSQEFKNGKVKKHLTQKIKITSSSFATNNMIVKATYEDSENLYVWVVIGK